MGARKVKWISTLKTRNSGVTYEPHNYLVLSVHCMWTCTFQHGKKNCNNYAENIWQHCTNFSFLGSQAPGICTPLLFDNEEALNSTLNFLLTFSSKTNSPNNSLVYYITDYYIEIIIFVGAVCYGQRNLPSNTKNILIIIISM